MFLKAKQSKNGELSQLHCFLEHGFLYLQHGNNTWDILGESREKTELLTFLCYRA